jgi:hypothetical protein
MTRLRILLLSIGLAIAGGGLAGCAGSCSERVLLQPHAYPTADFKTSPEPEPDALWIDGRDLSLYLSPCYSQPDNGPPIASGPGTLCGTLILPPGVRFRFEAAQAALVDASSGQRTPLELHGVDFALTKEREGFDGAHPTSFLVNRLYTMPGTRLNFQVLGQHPGAPATLSLPGFTVNGRPLEFPAVTITPSLGQRCYRGAW